MTILSLPLLRMMRMMNSAEDRDSEVNINFVIIVSFIVFYSPLSSLIFIRLNKYFSSDRHQNIFVGTVRNIFPELNENNFLYLQRLSEDRDPLSNAAQ